MQRKALIPILCVFLLAGLTTVMSYTSVTVQTKGKLNIVNTDSALLALLPGTASHIANDRLILDFTSTGDQGLQTNSTYSFQRAFHIKNNSDTAVTVRLNDDPFEPYATMVSKAYIRKDNIYYDHALTKGLPLGPHQTASIDLMIDVGAASINLTTFDLSLTAEKGLSSDNPGHGGTPPEDGSDDSDDSQNSCSNPGHCKHKIKRLLTDVDHLHHDIDAIVNDAVKKNNTIYDASLKKAEVVDKLADVNSYYEGAQDQFDRAEEILNQIEQIADQIKINDNSHLGRSMIRVASDHDKENENIEAILEYMRHAKQWQNAANGYTFE
ncbi:hypothetical protein [Tuberibacillus sp. Marseille-P3662]|uniref:hypothetical protein n=1 Tax=Tuberibacillus sp. Marseille-P3662 TaxID=1965358 RepID=UPI000A1CDE1C|nr:hypothetical protein [Tuberibacillus sp. Marseille-P3662]